ncbi:hypothetical protein Tco_0444459 [Tanacetum coccineum]
MLDPSQRLIDPWGNLENLELPSVIRDYLIGMITKFIKFIEFELSVIHSHRNYKDRSLLALKASRLCATARSERWSMPFHTHLVRSTPRILFKPRFDTPLPTCLWVISGGRHDAGLRGSRPPLLINNFESHILRRRRTHTEANLALWHPFLQREYLRAECSLFLLQSSLTSIVDRPKMFLMTLPQNCTYGEIACIAHKLKWKVPVGAIQDWSFRKSIFQCMETSNAVIGKEMNGVILPQGDGSRSRTSLKSLDWSVRSTFPRELKGLGGLAQNLQPQSSSVMQAWSTDQGSGTNSFSPSLKMALKINASQPRSRLTAESFIHPGKFHKESGTSAWVSKFSGAVLELEQKLGSSCLRAMLDHNILKSTTSDEPAWVKEFVHSPWQHSP